MLKDVAPVPVLRRQLLAECRRLQQEKVEQLQQAMQAVQESANEQPGSSEDKFESFREACHIQRELFARQLEEARRSATLLQRLPDVQPTPGTIGLGSVVVTNRYTYFISISLGEFEVDGQRYCAMSTNSPLYQVMAAHKEGDKFAFRGVNYRIEAIY